MQKCFMFHVKHAKKTLTLNIGLYILVLNICCVYIKNKPENRENSRKSINILLILIKSKCRIKEFEVIYLER